MDTYISPFADRYSSKEMLYLFSPDYKFKTWRKLWIALAQAEKKLGLTRITDEHIDALVQNADNIDYETANRYEVELKHDVMAHIKAFEDQAPAAKGIIHLGATSAYVVDNTDLIILKNAYLHILIQLREVIDALSEFARHYAYLPTVAFTHFQPAQFTTVGKRTCLWIQDLMLDVEEVNTRYKSLKFLGIKGTTGTQASFLELFDGDEEKVKELDRLVTDQMGFDNSFSVSGQTYTRKIDAQAQASLAGIAQSAHKFANDLRLLQHRQEILEPFGKKQVGSSAMAYKRNPMKCERMTSLARLVMSLQTNAAFTAASQWFERTLDDSAGKRIALPEAFLAVDAILQLYVNIASGLEVNQDAIIAHTSDEIQDIASENLLMKAVKAGGNRQELHEKIRSYKMGQKAGYQYGILQDLLNDPAFKGFEVDLLADSYVGRAPSQTLEFLETEVKPLLRDMATLGTLKVAEVRV